MLLGLVAVEAVAESVLAAATAADRKLGLLARRAGARLFMALEALLASIVGCCWLGVAFSPFSAPETAEDEDDTEERMCVRLWARLVDRPLLLPPAQVTPLLWPPLTVLPLRAFSLGAGGSPAKTISSCKS